MDIVPDVLWVSGILVSSFLSCIYDLSAEFRYELKFIYNC